MEKSFFDGWGFEASGLILAIWGGGDSLIGSRMAWETWVA